MVPQEHSSLWETRIAFNIVAASLRSATYMFVYRTSSVLAAINIYVAARIASRSIVIIYVALCSRYDINRSPGEYSECRNHYYTINRTIRYSDVWSNKYIREGQWYSTVFWQHYFFFKHIYFVSKLCFLVIFLTGSDKILNKIPHEYTITL